MFNSIFLPYSQKVPVNLVPQGPTAETPLFLFPASSLFLFCSVLCITLYPSPLLPSDSQEYLAVHKCPSDCGCSPGPLVLLTVRDLDFRVKYPAEGTTEACRSKSVSRCSTTHFHNMLQDLRGLSLAFFVHFSTCLFISEWKVVHWAQYKLKWILLSKNDFSFVWMRHAPYEGKVNCSIMDFSSK